MEIIWNDEGAASVEYGLLLALIALAITAGVTALGVGVQNYYNSSAARISTLTGS